jgi:hypothetical protein
MTSRRWTWVISGSGVALLLMGGLIGFTVGRATVPEPERRFTVAPFREYYLYRYELATGRAWTAKAVYQTKGWQEVPESGRALQASSQ